MSDAHGRDFSERPAERDDPERRAILARLADRARQARRYRWQPLPLPEAYRHIDLAVARFDAADAEQFDEPLLCRFYATLAERPALLTEMCDLVEVARLPATPVPPGVMERVAARLAAAGLPLSHRSVPPESPAWAIPFAAALADWRRILAERLIAAEEGVAEAVRRAAGLRADDARRLLVAGGTDPVLRQAAALTMAGATPDAPLVGRAVDPTAEVAVYIMAFPEETVWRVTVEARRARSDEPISRPWRVEARLPGRTLTGAFDDDEPTTWVLAEPLRAADLADLTVVVRVEAVDDGGTAR